MGLLPYVLEITGIVTNIVLFNFHNTNQVNLYNSFFLTNEILSITESSLLAKSQCVETEKL